MGGQVWCLLWPSRGSIDALRVVLLCPLPQPSGRLLTLDGDGADSIDETLAAEGQGMAWTMEGQHRGGAPFIRVDHAKIYR